MIKNNASLEVINRLKQIKQQRDYINKDQNKDKEKKNYKKKKKSLNNKMLKTWLILLQINFHNKKIKELQMNLQLIRQNINKEKIRVYINYKFKKIYKKFILFIL